MKYKGTLLFLLGYLFMISINLAHATDFGPFSGKIVDADTKAPIEGVVVLVEWHKKQLLADASIYLDAQETVTDKDGNLYLPGIWVFNPFHRYTVYSIITIFKSGYEAERWAFSKWEEINPKVEDILKVEDKGPVIMLKKLTMEERRKNIPGEPIVPDNSYHSVKYKWILLRLEINKERKMLGFEELIDTDGFGR